jgi:hypothetical protein
MVSSRDTHHSRKMENVNYISKETVYYFSITHGPLELKLFLVLRASDQSGKHTVHSKMSTNKKM